jgi:P-type Mg2+ transporter
MAKDNQEFRYPYWTFPTAALLQEFCNNNNTTTEQKSHEYQESSLSSAEANLRLSKCGKNLVKSTKNTDLLSLLISQFKSPIIVIFIFTSVLSFFLGQTEDALIILSIVIVSGILGFWQEKGTTDAVTKLLAIVQLKTTETTISYN